MAIRLPQEKILEPHHCPLQVYKSSHIYISLDRGSVGEELKAQGQRNVISMWRACGSLDIETNVIPSSMVLQSPKTHKCTHQLLSHTHRFGCIIHSSD